MVYVLSKLFWFFAQPLNLIVFACAAGLLLMRYGKRRALGLRILKGGAIALILCTVLPAGAVFLVPLENRFPVLEPLPERVDGVIVLGGSLYPRISEGRNVVALGDGAERETVMMELYHRYPDARIVFSGGSAAILKEGVREADLAKRFVVEQGLDPGRFVFERNSRNTWENALESQALVAPKPGEVWLLITSAFHMPRSVGVFRKIGWNVTPCPVDFRLDGSLQWLEFKYVDRVVALDLALREWNGLVAYWLLGRTSSLFPAPAA